MYKVTIEQNVSTEHTMHETIWLLNLYNGDNEEIAKAVFSAAKEITTKLPGRFSISLSKDDKVLWEVIG